jgi:hypothetical protein
MIIKYFYLYTTQWFLALDKFLDNRPSNAGCVISFEDPDSQGKWITRRNCYHKIESISPRLWTPDSLWVHNSNLWLHYTKHIETKEGGSIIRQLECIRDARNCFMMMAMVMKSGFTIFHCTAIGRHWIHNTIDWIQVICISTSCAKGIYALWGVYYSIVVYNIVRRTIF